MNKYMELAQGLSKYFDFTIGELSQNTIADMPDPILDQLTVIRTELDKLLDNATLHQAVFNGVDYKDS